MAHEIHYDFTLLTEYDIYLFKRGEHTKIYEKLGAHLAERKKRKGVYFAVWAPNAKYVSVEGCASHRRGPVGNRPLRFGAWAWPDPDAAWRPARSAAGERGTNLAAVCRRDPGLSALLGGGVARRVAVRFTRPACPRHPGPSRACTAFGRLLLRVVGPGLVAFAVRLHRCADLARRPAPGANRGARVRRVVRRRQSGASQRDFRRHHPLRPAHRARPAHCLADLSQ